MRHGSRRWIYGMAVLTLAVAAAVAPGSPSAAATEAASDGRTALETLRVERGDTLSAMLTEAGVGAVDTDSVSKAIRRKTNLRNMSVGRQVRLLFGTDGTRRRTLLAASVETKPGRFVEATRTADGFYRARRTAFPLARALPPRARPPGGNERGLTVRRHDTIGKILRDHGITDRTIDTVVETLRGQFDPRRLMPGQSIAITTGRGVDGVLRLDGFTVHLEDGLAVTVARTEDGGFVACRTTGNASPDAAVHAAAGPARPDDDRPAAVPGASGRTTVGAATGTAEPSPRRALHPPHLRQGIAARLVKAPARGAAADPARPRREHAGAGIIRAGNVRVGRRFGGVAGARAQDRRPEPSGEVAVARSSSGSTEEPIASHADPVPVPPALLPSFEKHIEVRSGDTLMAVFRRHGIDRREADRAIRATRKLFNPRRLRIGQEIVLVTGVDRTGADTLEAVGIRIDADRFVRVSRAPGGAFEAMHVAALDINIDRPPAAAGAAVPPTEGARHAGGADRAGNGQTTNGAVVAGAAPVAPADEPRDAIIAAAPGGAVPIPAPGDPDDADDGLVRKAVVIGKGDTLSIALTRAGSTRADAEDAIVAFRAVHDPRRLQVGQTLSVGFEPEGETNGAVRLATFTLNVAPDRDVVVARGDDGVFLSHEVERPLGRVLRRQIGVIETSLYQAALAVGVPNQAVAELTHIFSFDVDFQRDIQPGDGFELLYEAAYDRNGEFVENGPLLYATLEAGKQAFELFRYEPDDGPADYLDSRGQSARKALMRTPINGARLSSGYGMRKHPILGYSKKHLGVDFAAPKGTPILAAGDGTIERIGREGNYGKYIRIRHNGTYSTAYAHLSGYAKGMSKGKRVRQGQVIGYVGSTGMSTGPHLHYEVLRNHKRINPTALKLPTGRKLEGKELAAFREQIREIRALLAETPSTTRLAHR